MLARLGTLVEVVAQPIYVWLFGLAGYGLYAVLWAWVNLVENIADLGTTSALQRLVPRADERTAATVLAAALLVGMAPCIAIAAIVTLFAPDVALAMNVAPDDRAILVPAVRLFAWAIPLWAGVELATAALRARHSFGPEIRLRLLWEQLLRLGFALALYLLWGSLLALIVAHLLSLAVTALLGLRLVLRGYRLGGVTAADLARAVPDVARAGLAMLPASLVGRAFSDGPPIVINALLPGAAGAATGGLYVIVRKVSSIVQLVRTAFAYVLTPLAAAADRGGRAEVAAIYGFATRLSLALAVPLGLVMAAGGAVILGFYGADARAGLAALTLLVLARIVEAAAGPAPAVQQAVGGYRHQLIASLSGVGLAALLALPLFGALGLTGMAAAVAAGFVVAALIPAVQLWRHDGLNPFGSGFVRALLGALLISAPFAALALASVRLGRWPALGLLLLCAAGALWCSLRFALVRDDRLALGALGRRLGLGG